LLHNILKLIVYIIKIIGGAANSFS